MPQFDPCGANEAGYPWEEGYARINRKYFDMADVRLNDLVSGGILPCIVGCWGYYHTILGERKMKQHWRNIVARSGALPVVWCLAGEGSMPYYLSPRREQDAAAQKHGWAVMGKYVREIDPLLTNSNSSSAGPTASFGTRCCPLVNGSLRCLHTCPRSSVGDQRRSGVGILR